MSPYVDTLQNFSVISNPLGTITSGIGGTAGLNGTTRVLNPAGPFAANGGMQVGLPTQSFFGGVSANNGLSPAGPFAGSNYGLSTNLLNSTPSVAATPFLRTANVAGAPAARTSALSFN